MQVWLSKKDKVLMIVGGAVRSPELKKIGKYETSKASFSLGYKADDGQNVYCNCAAYGRIADYACNIEKGSVVNVIGKLETRPYVGKDGTPKEWKEVSVKWMNILGEEPSYLPEGFEPPLMENSNEDTKVSQTSSETSSGAGFVDIESEEDEDLPF